ncbi:hypothetical protein BH09MYX1_BH09MYX1_01100 [soil metagenome]
MKRCRILSLSIVLFACSPSPEPDVVDQQPQSVTNDVPAFVLDQSQSKFGLGSLQTTTDVGGLVKRAGTWGTKTTSAPGALISLSNNDSPVLSRPLEFTAAQHNSFVQNYYVSRGMPSNQIEMVAINSLLEGHEVRGDKPVSGTLLMFTTVISRRVPGGAAIVDSLANASCPTSDACAFEIVFWPLIKGAIVDNASAISQMLADPVTKANFLDALPTTNKVGNVVIRHSSWRTSPMVCFASYDVFEKGSVRHFDLKAKELFLPEESIIGQPESAHPW